MRLMMGRWPIGGVLWVAMMLRSMAMVLLLLLLLLVLVMLLLLLRVMAVWIHHVGLIVSSVCDCHS